MSSCLLLTALLSGVLAVTALPSGPSWTASSMSASSSVPPPSPPLRLVYQRRSDFAATKGVEGAFADLQLPADKEPMDFGDFMKGKRWRYYKESNMFSNEGAEKFEEKDVTNSIGAASKFLETAARKYEEAEAEKRGHRAADPARDPPLRQHVGNKTVALGSSEEIFYTADVGLLAGVLEAYNHHWNLRVSPEDFWFPVIRRVAKAIDDNSKKEEVRQFFVDFDGKKTINVHVNSNNIYHVDYPWLFEQFAKGIKDNVKVPSYADLVRADFSTTTPELAIVADITLMASLQEFFEFEMSLACGLKGVEMIGTLKDWERLVQKLRDLKKLLEPLDAALGGLQPWFGDLETIFGKLVDTFKGDVDYDWWSRIVTDKVQYGSGGGEFFDGWIIKLIEGKAVTKQSSVSSGLLTVPMKITHPDGVTQDNSTLVAGMLGYTVSNVSPNGIPSVQPFQGWAMLLDPESTLRWF